MSLTDGLHPVTTEGQILLHIANQLDELVAMQRGPAPAEPEPKADASADDKPAAKKPPAKKTTARRKVTGQ